MIYPLCRMVGACRLALLFASLSVFARAAAPAPTAIFDGRTLAGWEGNPQSWRVEDGAITGEIAAGQRLGKNEFLYWQGEVADFDLSLEFQITGGPTANSGIQFRAQKLPDGHAAGYQADLDQGAAWLGRIYDEHGRALLVERGERVSISPDGRRWSEKFGEPGDYAALLRPTGQWNTYRVLATASHVELWVNGTRVSVLDDHQADAADFSGKLALQLHSGAGPVKVQFRNVQLTQLGRTAAPPADRLHAATRAAAPTQSVGVTRKNGDPPLRRTAGVEDLSRLGSSAVLWHLGDNPAQPSRVANPSAQKLVAGLKLVSGFRAELIAAEPEVHQPVAMAFDDRGRIWIAEAFGYPNKQPEGKGKDRILILEDKDGDGAFETKKTFVEGLNLVSGLEVGFGGVWVGAAPHLLFIPDRNRDDVPDAAGEVLLDGWGFQDTHETLNSFTWGPDGWLYGCHGVFTHSFVGKPGTPQEKRQKIRAGVWRYHPVRHEFEVFAHGGSNQWGLDFNTVGHLFMTHCRSFHGGGGTTYVLRNGHYWNQANNDYGPFVSNRAPDFAPQLKNFLLASARYDSGEGGAGKPGTTAVYGGHSHVGTMIYLGDNWPAIYRDHLFTHNLHGHQINHQINVRTGSAYETFHAGYDMLFSPDATYLPVDLQYGPDGGVYVIDWSDIQHCHTPRDEVWDRTNGRVYRVAWQATFQPAKVDLAAKNDSELVALQDHRNEWFVRMARRILQERAATRALDRAAVETVRKRLAAGTDAAGYLRALWTLHVTKQLEPADYARALEHPAEEVRGWAVQLGTERPDALGVSAEALERLAKNEKSALVRLAVASAVPALPVATRWPVTAALAARAEDAADRYLPKMVWFALAPTIATDVPRALELAARTPMPTLADSILWFAARTPEGRTQISQRALQLPEAFAARAVRVLAFSLENEAGLAMPASWAQVTARFGQSSDAAVRTAIEQLSALFGDKSVLGPVRERLANPSTPLAERRRAVDLLRRAGDTESTTLLVKLLGDAQMRATVIPLLGTAADAKSAASGLIGSFKQFNDTERTAALATLTSKPALALPLLHAVETGALEKKHLTALHARQLRNLRNAEVTQTLDRVWGRAGETSTNAQAAIARFRSIYREAPLWSYDAKAGRQVFERVCASCHAVDEASAKIGKLGPNLAGTWRNGLDYFLENIIDPNAVVGTDFQLNLVTKRDGTVVSGMIEKESDTALLVRTMTDSVTVPKTEVKAREVTTQSLMPAGLLEALPQREAIELLLFLTTESK